MLLDRDYRAEGHCRGVRKRLQAVSVTCHVWQRKELESYLLDSRAIARVSGADEVSVEEHLAHAAEESEDDVFAQVVAETLKEFPRDRQSQAAKEGRRRFVELWRDRRKRHWVAPPERVLHGLNRRLSANGHSTVSFRALARRLEAREVPSEVVKFLDLVESALEDAGVPRVVS